MKRNMRIWSILLTLIMVLSVALPTNAQESISTDPQTNVEDSTEDNQDDAGEVTGSGDNTPLDDVGGDPFENGSQQNDTREETEQDPGSEKGEENTDSEEPDVEADNPPQISYQSHVQTYGWQDWVSNGEQAGTTDQAKRMEAIAIKIEDMTEPEEPEIPANEEQQEAEEDVSVEASESVANENIVDNNEEEVTEVSPAEEEPELELDGIRYQVHGQSYGWQGWKYDGEVAGTTGQKKRIEAIQIELTGKYATEYDIYYRVHSQSYGWLGWAKNGEKAGTSAYAKRLEAIEIRLVSKGAEAPGPTENAYYAPQIIYQSHVQTIGWQVQKFDGQLSGTEGSAKRLEGIKISLHDPEYNGGIEYRTHIQSIGWQGWKSDGQLSGTTGQKKRIEAIQIQLTGEMANHYDVYYRVHCQTKGWTSWTCNGKVAGTEGFAKRLEAIEIKLEVKDPSNPEPGQAYLRKFKNEEVGFFGYVREKGDVSAAGNNAVLGTTGQSMHLEGFGINLDQSSGEVPGGTIQYRTHVQNNGWTNWVNQGTYSGTKNENKRLEAIQIRLSGEISQYYDIYYRAHVQSYGWLGWTKNGGIAGTTGISYRVEAVQIYLLPKNEKGPATSSSSYKTVVNLPSQSGSALASFGSYTMSSGVRNRLNSAISNFTRIGRRVGFYVVDLTNGKGIYYNSNNSFYSASTIKGPYVVSLNENVPGSATASRSLMQSTIKVSDNSAYLALRRTYGSAPFASWLQAAGCSGVNTSRNYTDLTPRQLAQMWAKCYEYFYSGKPNSTFCRGLFTGTLNSPISNTLKSKYTVYSKAGWIGEGGYYNVQNDAGIIMRGGHPYVVVILSTAYGRLDYMNTLVSAIDAAHEEMMR